MVERDQGKGAETPEDEGVGQAGQRALADDLGLEEPPPRRTRECAGLPARARSREWGARGE